MEFGIIDESKKAVWVALGYYNRTTEILILKYHHRYEYRDKVPTLT